MSARQSGRPGREPRLRGSGWLLLLGLLLAPGWSQDVFCGGRVDVEFVSDRSTRFSFGREAGLDVTFSKPQVIDAYVDLNLAGGRARVQEFYVSPPQTRRIAEVRVGRFLLPYGDPRTNVADRYAPGGPDLFDTYRGYRHGNVFLDTDVLGVWVRRDVGPVRLEAVGASTPNNKPCAAARLVGTAGKARAGVSIFQGSGQTGAELRQGALHFGYRSGGLDALGQVFLGRALGAEHHGWVARVGLTPPRSPVTITGAWTLYHQPNQPTTASTRLGVEYRFAQHYRSEVRYEFTQAPRPNQDNRLVLRLLAVF